MSVVLGSGREHGEDKTKKGKGARGLPAAEGKEAGLLWSWG